MNKPKIGESYPCLVNIQGKGEKTKYEIEFFLTEQERTAHLVECFASGSSCPGILATGKVLPTNEIEIQMGNEVMKMKCQQLFPE